MLAYLFALGTVLTTLFGGWLSLRFKDKLYLLISFTAGVVLTIAFLEVLHELFEIVNKSNFHSDFYLGLVLVGFLGFHLLGKFMSLNGAHESEFAPHPHPYVVMLPLSF